MPRYYYHLSDRTGMILDPEGLEHENVHFALAAARHAIRGMIGADVCAGEIDLRQEIVLTSEEGQVVERIPFTACIAFRYPSDPLSELCLRLGAAAATSTTAEGPSAHQG